MFTFQLEGEVIGQVSTFMIASEKPQRVGIPDLERPQVEDTLLSVSMENELRTSEKEFVQFVPRY